MHTGSGFIADLASLYPDLDASFLAHADSGFEEVSVAGGAPLVREGAPSDALYILLSGRLAATRMGTDGRARRLGEIGRGELVGEMSVLAGGTRTATVTALRDSRLLRISNEAFLAFMQRHPSVTRQFVRILVDRLVNRGGNRSEKLSTVALAPAGGADRVQAFARALAGAMKAHASVLVVDAAMVAASRPGELAGENGEALAGWLNDLELRHDLLLYVCSPRPDAWTRLCLRQADRVLLVADASDPADPGEVEDFLLGEAAEDVRGSELVLLHPEVARLPADTARWISLRALQRHHHLRQGDPAGMARLCRHLLGRSVGLALGGGGARAFAEVGVLRALAEHGIPVDVIGGTSMGAVIGALAARGDDHAAIHGRMRELVRLKPFSGMTVPLVALLSGRRLRAGMRTLFGDARIEDLWLRYCCVACNLTRGTVEAREAGDLARWVTASNAIPGVVPPVLSRGELFVDGGLLNNVPADLVAARNSGPVIAVNVSGAVRLDTAAPDDADLSGWGLLLDRIGHGRRMPGLGRILVRSMLLGSSNHAAAMRGQAALYLAPELEGVDVNDWEALDSLAESGYRYASEALQGWSHVI